MLWVMRLLILKIKKQKEEKFNEELDKKRNDEKKTIKNNINNEESLNKKTFWKKFKVIFFLGLGLFVFFHSLRSLIYPHFPIIYNVIEYPIRNIVEMIGSLICIEDFFGTCLFFFLIKPIIYIILAFFEIASYMFLACILYFIYDAVICRIFQKQNK